MYIHYIATGSTFIPCSKVLQPDTIRTRIPNWTESIYKINSNNYGKHEIILHNWSVHRHESIDNPCTFLHNHRQATSHSHRQSSTPVIGTNPSPLLDLAISCPFPIGTNPHQQLFCRLTTTSLPADLHLINSRYTSKDTCPKTVSTSSMLIMEWNMELSIYHCMCNREHLSISFIQG